MLVGSRPGVAKRLGVDYDTCRGRGIRGGDMHGEISRQRIEFRT